MEKVGVRERAGVALYSERLKKLGKRVLVGAAAALGLSPIVGRATIANTEVSDTIGPHTATFGYRFDDESKIDLGPFGNAYLPIAKDGVGLDVTVHGVTANLTDGQLLQSYISLAADPTEALEGVENKLSREAERNLLLSEAALVALIIGAAGLQRFIVSEEVSRRITPRRIITASLTVAALTTGSALAPAQSDEQPRIPISVVNGTPFQGMTVDSELLAVVLNNGISGLQLLMDRQLAATKEYVADTGSDLLAQRERLLRPAQDETLLLAFTDLHCSQAMTQLITQLSGLVRPDIVVSAGDDTITGSAFEKICINKEAAIAHGLPFEIGPGNHDTDETEKQEKEIGANPLDGKREIIPLGEINGVKVTASVIGASDPEHTVPFSTKRVLKGTKTEDQVGKELGEAADKAQIDMMIGHQPYMMQQAIAELKNNWPALIFYGHMHFQDGPYAIRHDDGSWTVQLQGGTAGGVREPTLTTFSSPFTPPLVTAPVYLMTRDNATGLITREQTIEFTTDKKVRIETPQVFGDVALLPHETYERLASAHH